MQNKIASSLIKQRNRSDIKDLKVKFIKDNNLQKVQYIRYMHIFSQR